MVFNVCFLLLHQPENLFRAIYFISLLFSKQIEISLKKLANIDYFQDVSIVAIQNYFQFMNLENPNFLWKLN